MSETSWSYRLRQTGEWALLFILVLPAVQPLLKGRLPWAADSLLHFHRLAQLDRALKNGLFFPRWAPDMGFGYGFPLFNYYAPLSYYLSEPFRWFGLDTQGTLLASFICAACVACAGSYLWGRDLGGKTAGIAAGVAFTYAPYMLHNVYDRGALAEVWALALVPFVFRSVRCLVVHERRRDWALTSFAYGALILTHNITALIATPLLIAYGLVLWVSAGRERRRILSVASSLLFGLGLTAFFWVPALVEQDYVQIHQLFAPADLDFHNNFSTLRELFSAPCSVDPSLINRPTLRSLGWPQLVLAAWAIVSILTGNEPRSKTQLVLLGLFVLGLVLMTLPVSLPIWESVHLLRFVQFPWRFLGLTSLFLAVLAGVGTARIPLLGSLRVPLVQVVVVIFALTWLFPRFYPEQREPSPLDLIAFERDTGALGTTSAGDFLPVWVRSLPPSDSLLSAYEAAGPDWVIPRLNEASLPAGTQVLEAKYGLMSADLKIDSPTDFEVTFNWFFFPGWWGWLDGETLELGPVGEHGLVGADIPAGTHHVVVQFGQTTVRNWAGRASFASLGAVLLLLALWQSVPTPSAPAQDQPQWRLLVACAGLAGVLFLLKVCYLDTHESWVRRTKFDGETVTSVEHPLQVDFGGQLELLGYEVHVPGAASLATGDVTVPADGLVDVALYWRAIQSLNVDYSVAVHLVDEQGRRYGQKDSQHPAAYPTSRWEMGMYGYDQHRVTIWPGTPPGEYAILVSVYDVTSGRSLDVRDAGSSQAGTTYVLGSIEVIRPRRPVSPQGASVGEPLYVDVGGGVRLVGIVPPAPVVDAGGYLPFTLFWYALEAPGCDYTARLTLVDGDGTVWGEELLTPGRESFPTSMWEAKELVRDGHSFVIPAITPSGEYTVNVELVTEAGEPVRAPAPFLRVDVRAPDRRFDVPPIEYLTTASFGNLAYLLGYDLPEVKVGPGAELSITLYWQPQSTAETGYTVFVHLLDAEGQLVAGSDSVPSAGVRPTTGWLPGEAIADTHVVDVPDTALAGDYFLEVGIYDPASGVRLMVSDDQGQVIGDHVVLEVAIEVG